MGLGILEPRSTENVPGTTRYFEDLDRPHPASSTSTSLKYDTSGPVPIILVPQPSDDPNDPLNWPLWKRDLIVTILSIVSIFATCLGPILAANTLTLSLYFGLKFTKVAILTGWYLLGVGIAAIFFVPSARIWGKRHLFLVGTITLIWSSVWAGAVKHNYDSLAAARFFQGVGTAPFETLVNAAVGDLYFVHERGKRMALTNLAVFGGAFFTPILVGRITHVESLGWPWTFYFVAIFTGVCLPLVYLFVPETAFVRPDYLNTDITTDAHIPEQETYQKNADEGAEGVYELNESPPEPVDLNAEIGVSRHGPTLLAGAGTPKKSRSELLRIFNGRVSSESFWRLSLRPFPLFFHPAILWACFIQGVMVGWTVFIGIILAAIFLGPPLFWDEEKTGYAYAGAFIGAVIGFLIAGALADWSAKYLTRKNNGIYEPEFRIVLVIPQLLFGCTGLYMFGISAARLVDFSYYVPIAGFGFQVGGMVIGAVAASLYIIDAHRDIAIEAFTTIIIFKNLFSFGLTFSAYDWLVKAGTYKTFMWISSIQVLICLTSIPMYIYGKRNRDFFHRHDILRMCGLTNRKGGHRIGT